MHRAIFAVVAIGWLLGAAGCQAEPGRASGTGLEPAGRRPQLLAVLKEPRHPASRRAFQELRAMGCRDEAYRTFLLKALATPEIRAEDAVELLRAVAELGGEVAPLVSRQLAGKELSPTSRECHILVLAIMGEKARDCVPQLLKMLQDPKKTPELEVVLRVALAGIAADHPEHATWVEKAVKVGGSARTLCLRAMALADSRGWVSDEIIAAAEKIPSPSAMGDDAVWALTFLGRQGERAAGAKQKLKAISETGTWVPSIFAAATLARIDAVDRPAAARRLAKLADPGAMNDHTWGAVVRHAGQVIVGEETTAPLVTALDDRDDAVVRGAAYLLALVGLPASSAWEKLAGLVRSNRDESVRMHAAMALVAVAPCESIKDLKVLGGEARGAPGQIVKAGIGVIELRVGGEAPADRAAVEAALMRSFMVGSDRWRKVRAVMGRGSDEEALGLLKDFDLSARDSSGKNILHYAAEYGRAPTVEYILSQRPNLVSSTDGVFTPLSVAARNGHIRVVAILLDHGAPIEEPKRWPPLLCAARYGQTEVVKLLLERGADAKAKGESGQGLLHEAAKSGVKDLVALVIEKGADVNEQDRSGHTPLHEAAGSHTDEKDRSDVVALLLAKGAKIDAAVKGVTVLHFAAAGGYNKETVKLLLEKGAQPSVAEDGATPLHWAMYFTDPGYDRRHDLLQGCAIDIAKMLLDKGVDINARNKNGRTALDEACTGWHTKLAEFLRERGAKSGRDMAGGDKAP